MPSDIAPLPHQFLRTHAIRSGMDLLMFAHRSHLTHLDAALTLRGLGRAHHRVLYFLSRNPGQTVGDLLDTLGVTKQSLMRVTRELKKIGLIERRTGEHDRRQRLLFLTSEGKELEHDLFDNLHKNMARAYTAAGEDSVKGYWTLMQHLMDEETHQRFLTFANLGDVPS